MRVKGALVRTLATAGSRSQVSGFEFRVSGFGFRCSALVLRVSSFEVQVAGFKFRVSRFSFRISGRGYRVSSHGSVARRFEGSEGHARAESTPEQGKGASDCGLRVTSQAWVKRWLVGRV